MITIYNLSNIELERQQRLRKALELNMSYYASGNKTLTDKVRIVVEGQYSDTQECWLLKYIAEDGKLYSWTIFKWELDRDLKFIDEQEIKEETPEQILATIKKTVKAENRYFWAWRSKYKKTVFYCQIITPQGWKIRWDFVLYSDKVILAKQWIDEVSVDHDITIKSAAHAVKIAKAMAKESYGGKQYA